VQQEDRKCTLRRAVNQNSSVPSVCRCSAVRVRRKRAEASSQPQRVVHNQLQELTPGVMQQLPLHTAAAVVAHDALPLSAARPWLALQAVVASRVCVCCLVFSVEHLRMPLQRKTVTCATSAQNSYRPTTGLQSCTDTHHTTQHLGRSELATMLCQLKGWGCAPQRPAP
jgi:hypothetical protein